MTISAWNRFACSNRTIMTDWTGRAVWLGSSSNCVAISSCLTGSLVRLNGILRTVVSWLTLISTAVSGSRRCPVSFNCVRAGLTRIFTHTVTECSCFALMRKEVALQAVRSKRTGSMGHACAIKAPISSRALAILDYIFKSWCIRLTCEAVGTRFTSRSTCVRVHPISTDSLSRWATSCITSCRHYGPSITGCKVRITCWCLRCFLELSWSCAIMSTRTVNRPISSLRTEVLFRTGKTRRISNLAPFRIISACSTRILIFVFGIDGAVMARRTEISRWRWSSWTEIPSRTVNTVW